MMKKLRSNRHGIVDNFVHLTLKALVVVTKHVRVDRVAIYTETVLFKRGTNLLGRIFFLIQRWVARMKKI